MTTIMLMTVESKTDIRVIRKSNPIFTLPLGLLSPSYPLSFRGGIGKVKTFLLNLSKKCCNSV
jgi:hypothetical protein